MSATSIVILKGLPASGKSTWAKEQVKNNPNIVRVNKDDLRAMCHASVWSKDREKVIIVMRDAMIETALKAGLNVIVDDTNLHPLHEKRIREISRQHDSVVAVKFFDVDVEECIKRDAGRGEAMVGEKVIRDMHARFLSE